MLRPPFAKPRNRALLCGPARKMQSYESAGEGISEQLTRKILGCEAFDGGAEESHRLL